MRASVLTRANLARARSVACWATMRAVFTSARASLSSASVIRMTWSMFIAASIAAIARVIRDLGLRPFVPPEPLPEITPDDVYCVTWLALV